MNKKLHLIGALIPVPAVRAHHGLMHRQQPKAAKLNRGGSTRSSMKYTRAVSRTAMATESAI